ncbi:MAG: hypothetical protein IJB39_05935 [Alistipes sp.]|nr:hypothetical protein [Alistipes sp.]
MKRIFLTLLALVTFVACNNTGDINVIIPNGYDLAFDENGDCYSKTTPGITQEEFEEKVVGHAWREVSNKRILENGEIEGGPEDLVLDGGSRHHLYFEQENVVIDYFVGYVKREGEVRLYECEGFKTYNSNFEAPKFYYDIEYKSCYRLILEVTENNMSCIWKQSEKTYTLVKYTKMTETELEEMQQEFTYDFGNL